VIVYAVAGWWRRGIVLNGRLRWGQTLFVDHLWAGSQRRGQPPRRRDPFSAEKGALCIRVRACSRHRLQWPPLQRGREDVVRACFVAAAIFVGGRVASREGGRACPCTFSRPPLSLAATAAPCAGARCSWRPSFSVPAAGTRPFLYEGAAGGGVPHLFGGRCVHKRPSFARCLRGVRLCEDRPLRKHSSSRAASDLKIGAPARSAAVLPCVPTHAGRL